MDNEVARAEYDENKGTDEQIIAELTSARREPDGSKTEINCK